MFLKEWVNLAALATAKPTSLLSGLSLIALFTLPTISTICLCTNTFVNRQWVWVRGHSGVTAVVVIFKLLSHPPTAMIPWLCCSHGKRSGAEVWPEGAQTAVTNWVQWSVYVSTRDPDEWILVWLLSLFNTLRCLFVAFSFGFIHIQSEVVAARVNRISWTLFVVLIN